MFVLFFLQTIQEGISALRNLITHVEDTGSDLTELSGPGEGSAFIEHKVTECRERYEKLYRLTEERGIMIGMTLQQEEQVEQKLEELLSVLEKKRDDFSNLDPVGVHPETIREQMEMMKVAKHDHFVVITFFVFSFVYSSFQECQYSLILASISFFIFKAYLEISIQI